MLHFAKIEQGGYFRFSNSSFKADEKLVTVSLNTSNTPDGKSGIYNVFIINHVEVLREQLRLNISFPIDKHDRDYSRIVLSTTVDNCLLSKGYQTTIFARMMMLNYKNTENKFRSCPFPKNSSFAMFNHIINDDYLPPMPREQKFKLEGNTYGTIRKSKGWKYLFTYVFFGRFKK